MEIAAKLLAGDRQYFTLLGVMLLAIIK